LFEIYEGLNIDIGDTIEYNCLGVKDKGKVLELHWFMNRWEITFQSSKGKGNITAPQHNCSVITKSYKEVN